MKNQVILVQVLAILILTISCEKSSNDPEPEIDAGFHLVINDSLRYDSADIWFYDFSSQLIYLNAGSSFSYADYGTFSLLINDEEIYTGYIHPLFSSYIPYGPVIYCAPTFYKDYIIPVSFEAYFGTEEYSNVDPRYDERIIEVLTSGNQYREGLSGEILSVHNLPENTVTITFQLTNHDPETLLIPDPGEMGSELFHYFTTGLVIRDTTGNSWTHQITVEQPEPWNSWNSEWLTGIDGDETKTFTLTYNDFENIPAGQYTAWFTYPGLTYQIEREELQQAGGRIWLGEVILSKSIVVE